MTGKERHKGPEIRTRKVSNEQVIDGEYLQSVFQKDQLRALKLKTKKFSLQEALSVVAYWYLKISEEEIKKLEKESGNKKDIFSVPSKSNKFVHAQVFLPKEDINALMQKPKRSVNRMRLLKR